MRIAQPSPFDALVVAAHGGAGASTLSMLTGARFDCGQRIPDPRAVHRPRGGWVPGLSHGQAAVQRPVEQPPWAEPSLFPLLLVARGNAAGSRALQESLTYAVGYGYTPVVAVVGDGPWPEPHSVTARVRMIERHGTPVVRVPYVPSWRYVDDLASHLPRSGVPITVVSAIKRIRVALGAPEQGGQR